MERPEDPTQPETGISDPPAGGYVLRAETGHFTLTGFPVGLTVEGPPDAKGRRVESKPASGGVALSKSDASGTVDIELHEPLLRGRPNEPSACRRLVDHMRSLGYTIEQGHEANDARGEDEILVIDGERVAVQLVSAPSDQTFWHQLAVRRNAQATWSHEEALAVLRAAIHAKRSKASGAILVVDASHIGAMLSQQFVAAYSELHGSVERKYSVRQCWLVGPTSRSVFRIP